MLLYAAMARVTLRRLAKPDLDSGGRISGPAVA
jgi:hypothetical protein